MTRFLLFPTYAHSDRATPIVALIIWGLSLIEILAAIECMLKDGGDGGRAVGGSRYVCTFIWLLFLSSCPRFGVQISRRTYLVTFIANSIGATQNVQQAM